MGLFLKYAEKATARIKLETWLRGGGERLLTEIETLTELQLEKALPKYFGADIDDWLQSPDGQSPVPEKNRRVVLLYDTYEALWATQPNKTDCNVDAWVRKLIGETPVVLHVILGRETLVWDNSEWGEIIQPFPLNNLPDADAQAFLQAVPIAEADIRTRMIEGAKGIPFYLELQVEQYATLKNQSRTPQAEDFGGESFQILDRFISHLPDTLRRALEIAAQAQWLDEPLFLSLCQQFLGGRASVRFSDLTRYSFWTESNGRYYLHAVLREYVHSQLRQNEAVLFAEIHRYLFDYYDGQLQDIESARDLTSVHITALTEGAYHLAQVAQVEVPYWVGEYRGYLHLAAQWAVLQPLLQQSLLICQEVGNKEGEGAELNNLSSIFHARGDYDTALDYIQKSLVISREIGDKAGEGTELNNLSSIYHARGDYDTALDYLQQSLEIQQEIGEKVGESAVLNNLSQIYKVQGDYVTALYYLQQSLSISRVIGFKKGVGQSLNNLATIAYAKGDYDTALRYSQQSMAIRLEIGNKAGIGQSLNNLSQIYMARGDYVTATDYSQQSLAIQREIGDQAGISLSLYNVGHIYLQNGEPVLAMQHWREAYQIAKKIGEAQALNVLEKLAENLGLPNGLAGWDALAQQMEGT
ncbi:MAG: tetratricopeptide repeat protein [Gallionella sp.]|nr:tetratricopeptide repeat protein [Gallionella sp.]